MHTVDTYHPNPRLEGKLKILFGLRQGTKVNWDRTAYFDLLNDFGNDHHRLPPVIHVAGTNGKGSIVAMLRAMLQAQGYRVHAYTSPHLIRVNERIVLAGEMISDEALLNLIEIIWPHIAGKPYSFFEVLTALAFRAFAQTPADVLLLEVGVGGRLDCTNVIDAPISTVISRISMDHKEYLGDTLAKIATEKAGIMKPAVPCIIGYQGEGQGQSEVINTLNHCAAKAAAKPLFFGKDWSCQTTGNAMSFTFESVQRILPLPSLSGAHQLWNAGAALAVLESVKAMLPVSLEAQQKGLQSIDWPARMQRLDPALYGLPPGSELWLDAGHNDSAGEVLGGILQDWKKQDARKIHVIVGMLSSKDMEAFLNPLLPHADSLKIVSIPQEPSSKIIQDIDFSRIPAQYRSKITQAQTIQDALRQAAAAPEALILIAGSVYLAGAVLKNIPG